MTQEFQNNYGAKFGIGISLSSILPRWLLGVFTSRKITVKSPRYGDATSVDTNGAAACVIVTEASGVAEIGEKSET